MNQDDYQLLIGDIKENGYDEDQPIVLYQGDILDGWNRYRACNELGIAFNTTIFNGSDNDALDFVLRTNKRRNLTSSQWAAIAVEADEIFDRIAEQVEDKRRKKQAEALKETHRNNTFGDGVNVKKLTQTKPERASQKIADVFNTNRTYVSDAKKLKEEEPEAFERIKSGETNFSQLKKEQKENKKIEKRQEAILTFERASEEYVDEDIKIYIEQFQDGCNRIDDNSVDAIITDPPYPIEYIDLWADMFKVADRILKPSSFLVAYANHQNLDKIFQLPNNLKYYWTFKLDFTAKPIAMGRNLIATWKPVIVWQKLPFKKIEETIEDNVKETKDFKYNERDYHDLNWAQSLGKFEYLISKFSKPLDLIVEPFAGTGTTLVACKNTKRKCIGFEVESKYDKIIKGRIAKGE
jgi:hypothetical protein